MKNDHLTTASNSSWGDGTIASVRRWVSSSTGLGIIFILAKRDIVYALNHIHFYLQLSIACLIPALYVKSYLDYITNNGTLVLNAPYRMPLLLTVSLMTFFFGINSTLQLAGEKEKGTLEILFYGPITSPVFILGKLGGALILYVFQICVLMMFLTFISIMSGILIDIRTLCLLGISVLPSLSMCAVGLGIAGLAGKQRLAVGLMGGLILLFILAEIGQQFAVSQPGDSVLGSAATVLASFTDWIGWMSPYRSFWRAGEALMMDSWRYFFLYLLSAIFYAGMMVTASIRILDIKGVQRWRE